MCRLIRAQHWDPVTQIDNPYIGDFLSNNGTLYASSADGVYKSTDNGDTWNSYSAGFHASSVRVFLNTDAGTLAGTFDNGAFISHDDGLTWEPFPNINTSGIRGLAKSNTGLFAATLTDGLLRSTDGGTTWERVMSSVRDTYIRTVAAQGNTVLSATFSAGAYRSTDNGDTWSPLSSGLTDTDIESFTFIGSDVFAATTFSGFIFRSTDDGETWTQSSNGLSNYSSVHKVVEADNYLFAAAGDGVYVSDDGGNNWTLKNNGMTSTIMLTVEAYGSTVLAGTAEGYAYKSTDYGNTWTSINDGLPPVGYTSAIEAFNISGPNLMCATFSTDIFWRPADQVVTSVREENNSAPKVFALSQNYPNPFNPTTQISYNIPKAGMVHINVYNVLGERVAEIENGFRQAGSYNVTFNASDLASGVYYYRIESGSFTSTKKMILLR